jgi:hypothetical protein
VVVVLGFGDTVVVVVVVDVLAVGVLVAIEVVGDEVGGVIGVLLGPVTKMTAVS